VRGDLGAGVVHSVGAPAWPALSLILSADDGFALFTHGTGRILGPSDPGFASGFPVFKRSAVAGARTPIPSWHDRNAAACGALPGDVPRGLGQPGCELTPRSCPGHPPLLACDDT